MRFPRSAGLLLHPTSLPGPYGIGDLGPEAYRFADQLQSAGMKVWQVLPLNPTGYGDSPYQSFSAFAGNPLLISIDRLLESQLLEKADLDNKPEFPANSVEFGDVIRWKYSVLERAAERFLSESESLARRQFEEFCTENAAWLEDFALFMAAKQAHGGIIWTEWEPALAKREPEAIARWSERLSAAVQAHKFWQFEFARQWQALRTYCSERDIRLMGDVPIYVAHDSSDVWADPQLFYLDEDGEPTKIAGVPPDYFSATGQLWGNPIYRWDRMAADGYRWWIERFRASLALFDLTRLDHFRGFEAYWEVPGGEQTAQNGRWMKGPGAELFEVLTNALGDLPIVAENLGVITPEVETIRHRFGFPGMALLQFAFGTDPQGPTFRPHNYVHELVAYTGGHDNDTMVGWWTSGIADSTRTEEDLEREHEFTAKYLGFDRKNPELEINWVFIRALMASVADTVVFPVQDVLGLGSDSRMNLPGSRSGNWRWRLRRGELTEEHLSRLQQLTLLYDR